MSILSSTKAGAISNKVTVSYLLEHGFYHPKTRINSRTVAYDKNRIVIDKSHFLECATYTDDEIHFYLETRTTRYWFKVENILDLKLVLKYCSDEKKYRYLRLQMMNDSRTVKEPHIYY